MSLFEREEIVTCDQNRLYYQVAGGGEEALVLFHGFGQDGNSFSAQILQLRQRFTIYTFDLFYHGKSTRPDSILDPLEWQMIFKTFLKEESITHFHVAGYSMGGRFAILTTHQFPKQVKRLYLMAPDGVYRSPWYRLAILFKSIFRLLMYHPTRFQQLLDTAEILRLAPASLIKFSRRELAASDNRVKVYRSWVYFKSIFLPHQVIQSSLRSSGVKVDLFLGRKDYIIPAEQVAPIFEHLENVATHILDKRHHHITDAALEVISRPDF